MSFQNSFKYLDRSSVRFATPIESKLGIGHTKPDNFFNLPSVTSYSSSVQLKNKDLNETLILRTEVSIAPVRRLVGWSVIISILSASLSPHKVLRRHCGGQHGG